MPPGVVGDSVARSTARFKRLGRACQDNSDWKRLFGCGFPGFRGDLADSGRRVNRPVRDWWRQGAGGSVGLPAWQANSSRIVWLDSTRTVCSMFKRTPQEGNRRIFGGPVGGPGQIPTPTKAYSPAFLGVLSALAVQIFLFHGQVGTPGSHALPPRKCRGTTQAPRLFTDH
jgi:hypothetical protein